MSYFLSFWLNAKYQLRFLATSTTPFFCIWKQLRKKSYPHTVSKNTDITIEGFPRSGNTFAVAAFEFSQKDKKKIARHTHSIAQVVKSTELKIPTMLLIRQPRDAVISLVIREKILITTALKSYINYYESLSRYHNAVSIAPFDDITRNFGEIIANVNKKFGTTFNLFSHSPENVRKVFELVDKMELNFSGSIDETQVARPSVQRKILKKNIEKLYDAQPKQLVQKANSIYKLFIDEYKIQ